MTRASPPATVWILSRSKRLHSTRRLMEAAAALELPARVVDPARVVACWVAGRPGLAGVTTLPRVVVPRVGARSDLASVLLVRHLEQCGVTCLNPAAALGVARDKMATALTLLEHNLPVPDTAVVRHPGGLLAAVAAVGGLPVVLKRPRGSQGVGVLLVRTPAELESGALALAHRGETVLVQRFQAQGQGRDVRVLVVAGRAVAAMERRARRGEFRANVHQGGRAFAHEPPRAWLRLAQKAAGALGLGVAGVDLVAGPDGPLVLEVNASPGLKGIEAASGVDVARAVMAHARRLARVRVLAAA